MTASACAIGLVVMSAATLHGQPDESAPTVADERFGLAHIDLMDLHVVRNPDTPPSPLERLSAADMTDRYRMGASTGVAWHRWSMYWDLIDRGGTFDWRASDGIVARDAAHGLGTLAVLQGNPPGVASVSGAPPGLDALVFVTAGGGLTDDPAAATAIHDGNPWGRFVAAAVDRYRPGGSLATEKGWPDGRGVTAWEIGNEPNLRFFWPGTPSDYARFLEVAYLAAKWRDPTCTVMHAGIANDANGEAWFAQFLDALRRKGATSPLVARNGYYFDKTAWHWYTAPSNLTVGRPDRVAAMLAERGIPAKPLWVTEFGAPIWSEYPGPCWDPGSPLRVSVPEHSAFVWQSVAEGLVASAETMILFQLYDDCGNGRSSYDAFGLIRNHAANQCWNPPGHGCWRFDRSVAGTARPSYDAYRRVITELRGASVSRVTAPRAWQVVEFHRAPDTRVTIAWSKRRSAQVVQLPAGATTGLLYELDETGRVASTTVAATNGSFPLRLPGATNRNGHGGTPLVDGRPVILVEHGVAQPSSRRGDDASGGAAADRDAPFLALVRSLPAESAPLIELSMVAGDAQSNLSLFQFFYTMGAPPYDRNDWTPIGTVLPWPEQSQSGVVTVPFVGVPGTTYAFAGRAADAVGNWSELPLFGQASTRILPVLPVNPKASPVNPETPNVLPRNMASPGYSEAGPPMSRLGNRTRSPFTSH